MSKTIHSDNVKAALHKKGWEQKDLALELGVSAQAVTNWLKGSDFPRPKKLLSLATTLGLTFSELVAPNESDPIVAFRKKGASKTTLEHIQNAQAVGKLLKPLVAYIPKSQSIRSLIASPSMEYHELQSTAAEIRKRVGLGASAVLAYSDLIDQFKENGAVLVPVLWGEKVKHKNALHILLPDEKITFIFVNLDTRIEDFKFWMAHELAHVFTPDLAGTEQGENYADALAGALLFPELVAEKAYAVSIQQKNVTKEIEILEQYANEYEISVYSVFSEVNQFAKEKKLPLLRSSDKSIHQVRNMRSGKLVSEMVFDPLPADPKAYLAAAKHRFQSSFFDGIKAMMKERETGASYISQIMDIPLHDALTLHKELSH